MALMTGVPIAGGEDFASPALKRRSLLARLYQAAGRGAIAAALAGSILLTPAATVQAIIAALEGR